MTSWYVVHSHAKSEYKAAHHLERQGFEVYLPSYMRCRRHARRTDWVRAPLFPRYLFVAIDVASARWRAIQSTVGVSHLVCLGGGPAPVPDEILDEIRAFEDADGVVVLARRRPFEKGDVVRLLDGPFSDATGLFECETGEERVIVLLDLLGRKVKVKTRLEAIAAAA